MSKDGIRFRARDGYHPAMKKIYDERALSHVAQIVPNEDTLTEQQRLIREARRPTLTSKTTGRVDGFTVTLDPHTGTMSCSCGLAATATRYRPGCPHLAHFHARRIIR